jgi:hypothetical protein
MDTWILAAVLYGILAAACVALFKSYRDNRPRAICTVIVAGVIGVAAINGVALLVTDGYKTPGISRADVARTKGLEANRAYKAFVYTSPLAYNTGFTEPHFTLIGFADTKDGRVLNVDFVFGRTTQPLTLPVSKVIVQQDRQLPARMTLGVSNDNVRTYGKKRLAEPDPCRIRFAGITTCQHTPRFVTDPRGDLLLNDVLHDGVDQVVIRLSPTDYSRLL